jgi:hypothetical protein
MRASILFALAALSATVACGGARTSDLFDNASGANGADASTTPPSSGGGSDPGDPDAGLPTHPIGNGSEDSGKPADPPDASPPKDAAVDARDAGFDAGPPVTSDPGIYCGTEITGADRYCALHTSSCCATTFSTGGAPSYACMGTFSLPCNGTRLDCDDGADCPGQVCCGKLVNGRYTTVQCQAKCDASTGASVRFCDPEALVDECAPLGLQCNESSALPGHYRCN